MFRLVSAFEGHTSVASSGNVMYESQKYMILSSSYENQHFGVFLSHPRWNMDLLRPPTTKRCTIYYIFYSSQLLHVLSVFSPTCFTSYLFSLFSSLIFLLFSFVFISPFCLSAKMCLHSPNVAVSFSIPLYLYLYNHVLSSFTFHSCLFSNSYYLLMLFFLCPPKVFHNLTGIS